MALDKFRVDDAQLGKMIASGTGAAFVPATMQVDASGNEIVFNGTAVGSSSGNKANASAAATLPAVASQTNYLTGVDITFSGATAASVVVATIVGLLGGTQSLIVTVPAGATVAGAPLALTFNPPFPASAANTAIVVTLPALGAGNTNACVNARGFVK